MTRSRALGLPAHVKARIVKSLFCVGPYGAEVGGMSDQHMKDLRASARGTLGKVASVRRSAALELMAHGGPTRDPRVAADLSTVRVWQRRIDAGKVIWPLSEVSWEGALRRGRGRGPIRNLRLMADRLNWVPTPEGWRQGKQHFTWPDADYKVKWDFALHLCKMAEARPDCQGLVSGLSTQSLRQFKLDGQSQKDTVKTALNAALGGVWHEVRVHAVFEVGELCVRHHCPAWAAEGREVAPPTSALDAPPCVKLHGLLPAPKRQVVLNHELALVSKLGVHTLWIDGSGRHSNNLQFRRCGVGYYTDTGEHGARRVQTKEAAQGSGEQGPGCASSWGPNRVDEGSDADERSVLQRNGMVDLVGTREHVRLEPSDEWKQWGTVCQDARNFWFLVGPKLRLEQWPKQGQASGLEPEPEIVKTVASLATAMLPAALFVVGLHQRVVEHVTYAISNCGRKNLKLHALKGRPCMPLKRKRSAKLIAGFQEDGLERIHSAPSGRAEPPLANIS
eukprot:6463512-Amphidinium_carterae.1